jgi:hypothetical protein
MEVEFFDDHCKNKIVQDLFRKKLDAITTGNKPLPHAATALWMIWSKARLGSVAGFVSASVPSFPAASATHFTLEEVPASPDQQAEGSEQRRVTTPPPASSVSPPAPPVMLPPTPAPVKGPVPAAREPLGQKGQQSHDMGWTAWGTSAKRVSKNKSGPKPPPSGSSSALFTNFDSTST